MAAGENAECGAGIAHVSQAEQAIDDWDRVMQRYRAVDDDLGELIKNDNQNQPSTDELPFFCTQAASPALSTDAQRAQTVGWVGSLPTAGSYFQQRVHFAPSALRTRIRQLS